MQTGNRKSTHKRGDTREDPATVVTPSSSALPPLWAIEVRYGLRPNIQCPLGERIWKTNVSTLHRLQPLCFIMHNYRALPPSKVSVVMEGLLTVQRKRVFCDTATCVFYVCSICFLSFCLSVVYFVVASVNARVSHFTVLL